MAWDIGADELQPAVPARYVAFDAVIGATTKTRTASLDARIEQSGAGGGPWDIGADELTGESATQCGLDARIVDLTNSQTVTLSAAAAIAPQTPSGLTVVAAGVDWVSLSWTDNSGGTAQHRVYYRKIGTPTYTDWALLWLNDTTDTVRYLTPDTVYVFAVAAVASDLVEGPIITVTYPSVAGDTISTSMTSYLKGTEQLTCTVGAFLSYPSTGPGVVGDKYVSGRYV